MRRRTEPEPVARVTVVKPDGCASCGAELEQPGTGRPRVYCSVACRRLAERRIRVAEQLLSRARRKEQDYRFKASDPDWGQRAKQDHKFWAAEVASCEAELAALLAGTTDADDDASAAASTLAKRRRPQ